MEVLMDSVAAAKWLTLHGVKRSPGTLRKLRSIGGGPVYRKLNGRPYYTTKDLVAWVEARLSAPMGSASEEQVELVRKWLGDNR